jgi:hypothetical protein
MSSNVPKAAAPPSAVTPIEPGAKSPEISFIQLFVQHLRTNVRPDRIRGTTGQAQVQFNVKLDDIKRAYNAVETEYTKRYGQEEGPKRLKQDILTNALGIARALGAPGAAALIKSVAQVSAGTEPVNSLSLLRGFLNNAKDELTYQLGRRAQRSN